ncbi:MAG: glycosyltransferase [Chromatocurvus sp.]
MTPARLPSLAVSVVLHQSPLPRLRQTLASLLVALQEAQADGALGAVRVWLIDNSVDQVYRDEARRLLNDVLDARDAGVLTRFVALEQNAGFGGGHNRALLDDDSDYHLVLNPDVVLAHDALAVGLRLLSREPGAVAVSPRSSSPGGAREYLCKRYPSVLVLALRGFAPRWLRRRFAAQIAAYEMRDVCRGELPVEVPLISGCFMLMRGKAVRRVRGFDAQYFMYFEDFDLSLRLRLHGRLLYAPAVSIVHYGGYAAAKGWRHRRWFLQSGRRFFSQHGWRWI